MLEFTKEVNRKERNCDRRIFGLAIAPEVPTRHHTVRVGAQVSYHDHED